LYFLGYDHTPARLALADAAIGAAFRLRPNAGEAHLARAENLYRGRLDYDGALAELDIARRTLPNDPRIFELTGFIQWRQGKLEAVPTVADRWFIYALAERYASAAEAALEALRENTFGNDAVNFGRNFGEGLIARMTNDAAKARSAFTAARAEQEKRVQAQPDYGPALCVLGLIDAGLGRKEEALREGRRAVELLPVAKDFTDGVQMIEYFAMIAA